MAGATTTKSSLKIFNSSGRGKCECVFLNLELDYSWIHGTRSSRDLVVRPRSLASRQKEEFRFQSTKYSASFEGGNQRTLQNLNPKIVILDTSLSRLSHVLLLTTLSSHVCRAFGPLFATAAIAF